MTVYLVRHAKAVRRGAWRGASRMRPLAPGGHRQAWRLLDLLRDAPVTRAFTSPELHCRQTLEPLAGRRGLALESDEALGAGAGVEATWKLLASLRGQDALLCTHGERIVELLQRLCRGGLSLPDRMPCAKGSVWVLEGAPTAPESAGYLPPPSRLRAGETWDGLEESVPPLQGDKQRVAVLDLGSTSFHLMVADTTSGGEIRRVLRERVMLRLGAAVAGRGRIPKAARDQAVEAARALRRRADESRVSSLLPVATAALRDAENGAALAARIGEALGTPVRMLSGVEEARLIFAAFRRRVALGRAPALGLDLGGGSLELALGDDAGIHYEATLPLGVARLHRELVLGDPMSRAEQRALRQRVRAHVAEHADALLRGPGGTAVATGGTVSALARRIVTRRTSWSTRAFGQLFVPAAELAEVTRELVRTSHDQRLALPGVQRQRADLLPTGGVVLETLTRELGLDGFVVSDWGLREGVILEALGLARS